MNRIIIIEDEQSIADTVIHAVEKEGYTASWHTQGLSGLKEIEKNGAALVILDIGLPDVSGFELCKMIRRFSSIPIIFLTARDDEIDTIVGLELGGDDYMTKPFSPRELGARVKSVLRRAVRLQKATAKAPKETLCIDAEKMQALYHGIPLDLTRYEFKLLAALAKYPGRVFSRELLMQTVWDDDSPSLDRTVDAHIKAIRAKCKNVMPDTDPIATHRGTGYALKDSL